MGFGISKSNGSDAAYLCKSKRYQYIKEPTQKVIETALSQAPRAIQFVENPTEELLSTLVEKTGLF